MCNYIIQESSAYARYVYAPLHGEGLRLLDAVYLRGKSIERVSLSGVRWRGPHARDKAPMKGLGSTTTRYVLTARLLLLWLDMDSS